MSELFELNYPCLGIFKDTVYPKQEILTQRKTTRVLILDREGRIGMNHIAAEDEFGQRDHLESCGGGIEPGETLVQTAIREAREELGAEIFNLQPIGWIEDEYYLLQRRTRSYFFAAQLQALKLRRLTAFERTQMQEPVWLPPKELLQRLRPDQNTGVGILVCRRDWTALCAAIDQGLITAEDCKSDKQFSGAVCNQPEAAVQEAKEVDPK